VLSGNATVDVDGERFDLDAGDTMRIPGGDLRLVAAQTDAVFLVCGYSGARVSTPSGSHDGTTPAWIQ
jgi:quercetin dioxygenase-like cupin family protein